MAEVVGQPPAGLRWAMLGLALALMAAVPLLNLPSGDSGAGNSATADPTPAADSPRSPRLAASLTPTDAPVAGTPNTAGLPTGSAAAPDPGAPGPAGADPAAPAAAGSAGGAAAADLDGSAPVARGQVASSPAQRPAGGTAARTTAQKPAPAAASTRAPAPQPAPQPPAKTTTAAPPAPPPAAPTTTAEPAPPSQTCLLDKLLGQIICVPA